MAPEFGKSIHQLPLIPANVLKKHRVHECWREKTGGADFHARYLLARLLSRRSSSSPISPSMRSQAVGYQRLLQPPRHPPPPRTSLMISNIISAPMVALMIAAIMPEPRWMPS
jgi:hypothetical protein